MSPRLRRTASLERERANAVSSGVLVSALLGRWSLGLLVLGPGGRILDANLTAGELCGCADVADLFGRTLASLTHPDDRGWSSARLDELFADSSRSVREELRLLTPDGRSVEVELHLSGVQSNGDGTRYVIVAMGGIADRLRHEAELRQLADTDPLTGLYNRRRALLELEHHLERCRRYGPQGALMLLDIDGLKAVNDGAGHAAGDAVLRATADLLRARLRTTDVIGRMGGDEFAVLLPSATADDAARVACDLQDQSRSIEVDTGLSLSAGIVVIDDGTVTCGSLLETADVAMYEAKHAGGHRFAFAPVVPGPAS